ncbi:MAG: nuclear transport factor 2 family protein [Rhizobiaceae bacterium]
MRWMSCGSQVLKALLMACVVMLPTMAHASLETDILERWYALLGKADATGLDGLLAPRAKIKLNDLGTTQTKAEFLESMDAWREAIDGGAIRFRIDATAAGRATALVCYRFKSNDLLTREVFLMTRGLITQSEQSKVGDNCGELGD